MTSTKLRSLILTVSGILSSAVLAEWQPGLYTGSHDFGFSYSTEIITETNVAYDVSMATNAISLANAYHNYMYWGQIKLPAGTVKFATRYDDYAKVYIDGELVVDQSSSCGQKEGEIAFESEGWHDILISLVNGGPAISYTGVPASGGGIDGGSLGFAYATSADGVTFSEWIFPVEDGSKSVFRHDDGFGFSDTLFVSSSPDDIGSPVPSYGFTAGITAGREINCTFPGQSIINEGVSYHYTGYTVRKRENGAFSEISSGTADSFTLVHSGASTFLTWNYDCKYLVSFTGTLGGTLSTSGGYYSPGDTVTVTAIADDGSSFAEWTGDLPEGVDASNPVLTFTADDTVRYISANFNTDQRAVKVYIGADGGSWDVAANWSPASIPVKTDDVYIPEGIRVNVPSVAYMSSLVVSNNAAVSVSGATTARNAGVKFVNDSITNNGREISDIHSGVAPTLIAGADVILLGGAEVIVGGHGQSSHSLLSVGGNMTVGDGAAAVVYAGAEKNYYDNGTCGARIAVAGELKLESGSELEVFCHLGIATGTETTTGTAAPVFIETGKLTVEEGAVVSSSAGLSSRTTNYTGTAPWANGVPKNDFGGAGYGGAGGIGLNNNGTIYAGAGTYGAARRLAPIYPGAYGRSVCSLGGGVVWIKTGAAVIDGTVSVTPTVNLKGNSTWESGGGSGGSIFLAAATFSLGENALLKADGRDGYDHANHRSGGGGGGRIAVAVGDISQSQYESLVLTGTAEGFNAPLDMVSLYPGRVSVAGGAGVYKNGSSGEAGSAGEAVYYTAVREDILYGAVLFDSEEFSPQLTPAQGLYEIALGGSFSASASERVVIGEAGNVRRVCKGYVVTFADGTVQEGSSSNFELKELSQSFSVSWKYSDEQYLVQAKSSGSGSVSPLEYWADVGDTVEFTANAAASGRFLMWASPVYSYADAVTSEKLSFAVEGPLSVEAVFTSAERTAKTFIGSTNGSWSDGANWDPEGEPDTSNDVTIPAGIAVSVPLFASAGSLTLEDGAFVSVFGESCVFSKSTTGIFSEQSGLGLSIGRLAASSSPSQYSCGLYVAGDLTMKGASKMAIGGFDMMRKAVLRVLGDLSLSGTSQLAVYPGYPGTGNAPAMTAEENMAGGARLDVAGKFILSSGTTLYLHNHHVKASGAGSLHAVVVSASNIEFKDGSAVSSPAGGTYRQTQMRGFSGSRHDFSGGGHGGYGGGIDTNAPAVKGTAPYDNPYAPLYPGCFSRPVSGVGGGTIRIHADYVNLEGTLDASAKAVCAAGYEMGGSGGGSIWVTARNEIKVADTAKLLAAGQIGLPGGVNGNKGTGFGGGAGGRIALGRYISDEVLKSLYETGDYAKAAKYDLSDAASSAKFKIPQESFDVSGKEGHKAGQAGEDGTVYFVDGLPKRGFFFSVR